MMTATNDDTNTTLETTIEELHHTDAVQLAIDDNHHHLVNAEDTSTPQKRLNPINALLQSIITRAMANIRRSWKALLIGQILSLLLASSGAANASLHFECNLSAPTTQAGLIYLLLSFHLFCIPRHSYHETGVLLSVFGETSTSTSSRVTQIEDVDDDSPALNEDEMIRPRHLLFHCIPVHGSLRVYLIMAFLDVEANYLTYLAFRYTPLTSVSLLDALAIPSAMFFSRCLLRRIYKKPHYIGASICIIGIFANVLGDYQTDEGGDANANANGDDDGYVANNKYPHSIRGDILATGGALLYGLNDVLTERIVKDVGTKEYLGVMGLFGSIICLIQAIITERSSISAFFDSESETCQAFKGWSLLAASGLFGVMSYIGMSNFLIASEAALLNLSLLTGDLWAVIFSVVAERMMPSSNFWIALVLIVCGVFVYEVSPSHPRHDS